MARNSLSITAQIIRGVRYTPLHCKELAHYSFSSLTDTFPDASFFIDIDKQNAVAVSYWVSAKRTRTYPYARIYDTYGFSGKKVTVIPIYKDEGEDGDRDFIQWDTVSLMSLLNIYVIITYYKTASRNKAYLNKITKQRVDMDLVKRQIVELSRYQDTPLHWNYNQREKVREIGNKAIAAYREIGRQLGVRMNSEEGAERKINELMRDSEAFLQSSRAVADRAQRSESLMVHSSENISGIKARLTITNFLRGRYSFTADEARIEGNRIYLVEAKNTNKGELPNMNDIKDGLFKMIIFTNLENVEANGRRYKKVPVLKLTGLQPIRVGEKEAALLSSLVNEARQNGFNVEVNGEFI